MAEFPALPLWTDAWVADTHHLTRLLRGTYFDLLVLMWRTPGCRVPNDEGWLCARLRINTSEYVNELKPLINDLCQCDGNWITQKRLTREHEYVRARSDAQAVRAKLRWQKEKDVSQRNATPGNAPTPTPTPTPLTVFPSKPPPGDFEGFWICCPRKVGKGAAKKAYARAVLKTSPDLLVVAMRRYAQSRVGEPEQFTVHPTTWLNAERWTDEAQGASGAPVFSLSEEQQREERDNLIRMGVVKNVS